MNLYERILNLERTTIIGIGNIGIGSIKNMMMSFDAVDFLAIDADEALLNEVTCSKIKLGGSFFHEKLKKALNRCYLAIIVSCLGDEIGSRVAPLVALTTRSLGILSIGLIIMPIALESPIGKFKASRSLEELKLHLDTIVTISNKQLVNISKENKFEIIFKEACEALKWGTFSIISPISIPGYLNYDVTEVRRAFSRGTNLAKRGNLFIGYVKYEEIKKITELSVIKSMLFSIEFEKFDSIIVNINVPECDLSIFPEAANDLYRSLDEKIPEEAFVALSVIPDKNIFETLRIIVILINKC